MYSSKRSGPISYLVIVDPFTSQVQIYLRNLSVLMCRSKTTISKVDDIYSPKEQEKPSSQKT